MNPSILDLNLPDGEPVPELREDAELERIALPQVFEQPGLAAIQRGNLRNVEWLVARLQRDRIDQKEPGVLGPEYQALVNEFQPLLTWAASCWDFLQSTEGCRFLARSGQDRIWYRGEYRAVTNQDYSRMIYRVFRQCVVRFAQSSAEQSLAGFLRVEYWPAVHQAYCQLDVPADPRHRRLTAYSYLRCIPYRFLNNFHEALVAQAVDALPGAQRKAIRRYFLEFFTLGATADVLGRPTEQAQELLRRGLVTLLLRQRLVYCLLRQIERY